MMMMMIMLTMMVAERACWGVGDEWECRGDASEGSCVCLRNETEMRNERRTEQKLNEIVLKSPHNLQPDRRKKPHYLFQK